MISRIAIILSTLCMGNQAIAQVQELQPLDAIRYIREEFLGYSSLNGSSGGESCKIQVLKLEGLFGGIQVRIVDSRGAITTVSIDSPEVKIFRSITRMPEGMVLGYQIIASGAQSLIQVARDEDSSDFDLTLVSNNDLRSMKSCSVRE